MEGFQLWVNLKAKDKMVCAFPSFFSNNFSRLRRAIKTRRQSGYRSCRRMKEKSG